jgi:hypothetical protein
MFTVLYGSKSFVRFSGRAAALLKRADRALHAGDLDCAERLKSEAVAVEAASLAA